MTVFSQSAFFNFDETTYFLHLFNLSPNARLRIENSYYEKWISPFVFPKVQTFKCLRNKNYFAQYQIFMRFCSLPTDVILVAQIQIIIAHYPSLNER